MSARTSAPSRIAASAVTFCASGSGSVEKCQGSGGLEELQPELHSISSPGPAATAPPSGRPATLERTVAGSLGRDERSAWAPLSTSQLAVGPALTISPPVSCVPAAFTRRYVASASSPAKAIEVKFKRFSSTFSSLSSCLLSGAGNCSQVLL